MDELAYAAGIDPVELRLRNYAETDQNDGQAVHQQGAARLLRAGRGAVRLVAGATPEPRSMREGRELIGWGMATGVWEAHAAEDQPPARC